MHSEGCKCRECFGLAEYMLEATGRDHGLQHTLRVVTPGPPVLMSLETACDGTMVCVCRHCADERARRIRKGVRRDRSSPFKKAA